MTYWDARYRTGRGSGAGSQDAAAVWKAAEVRRLCIRYGACDVLDIGSGDGVVAGLMNLPPGVDYLGVDPSPEAVLRAAEHAPTLRFERLGAVPPTRRYAHLSLDVIFHLVTDDEYAAHLNVLCSARRLVIVHSTDHDAGNVGHVRHRRFTPDVAARGWRLVHVSTGGLAGGGQAMYAFVREPRA